MMKPETAAYMGDTPRVIFDTAEELFALIDVVEKQMTANLHKVEELNIQIEKYYDCTKFPLDVDEDINGVTKDKYEDKVEDLEGQNEVLEDLLWNLEHPEDPADRDERLP